MEIHVSNSSIQPLNWIRITLIQWHAHTLNCEIILELKQCISFHWRFVMNLNVSPLSSSSFFYFGFDLLFIIEMPLLSLVRLILLILQKKNKFFYIQHNWYDDTSLLWQSFESRNYSIEFRICYYFSSKKIIVILIIFPFTLHLNEKNLKKKNNLSKIHSKYIHLFRFRLLTRKPN